LTAGPAAITAIRRQAACRQYAYWRERALELLVDAVLAEPRLELEQKRPRVLVVAALDRGVQRRERRRQLLLLVRLQAAPQVARRGAVHPGDLHVAAERERRDPVLDAVAARLDDRRPEAEVELPRGHPDCASHEEVAGLVDEHEDREPDDRGADAHL
jgi:hypothetical protein